MTSSSDHDTTGDSDTTGDGGDGAHEVTSERAEASSALSVLGVGVLLLGLMGAVLFLAIPRGHELLVDKVLDDLFAGVDTPLPYELAAGNARLLPSGERVVTFGPLSEDTEGGPIALTIIEYAASKAEKVLADQFRNLRFESGEGMGHGGGRRGGRGGMGNGKDKDKPKPKLQEKAFLTWHGYDATFARLRHERERPETKSGPDGEAAPAGSDQKVDGEMRGDRRPSPRPFHEVVRVNLSTGGRCIIAYVRFADGTTGDKDAAAEILAAFTPRS